MCVVYAIYIATLYYESIVRVIPINRLLRASTVDAIVYCDCPKHKQKRPVIAVMVAPDSGVYTKHPGPYWTSLRVAVYYISVYIPTCCRIHYDCQLCSIFVRYVLAIYKALYIAVYYTPAVGNFILGVYRKCIFFSIKWICLELVYKVGY